MARKKKEEVEGEVEAAAEGKGGGKKKLIIIVVAVVAVLGVGYKLGFIPPGGKAKAKAEVAPTPTPVEGEVVDIGAMTVNLHHNEGYARVGMAVVFDASHAGGEEAFARVPLLKDGAISTISEFSSDELTSHKGQEKLRHELTEIAHEVWEAEVEGVAPPVIEVVLTELIIQ